MTFLKLSITLQSTAGDVQCRFYAFFVVNLIFQSASFTFSIDCLMVRSFLVTFVDLFFLSRSTARRRALFSSSVTDLLSLFLSLIL